MKFTDVLTIAASLCLAVMIAFSPTEPVTFVSPQEAEEVYGAQCYLTGALTTLCSGNCGRMWVGMQLPSSIGTKRNNTPRPCGTNRYCTTWGGLSNVACSTPPSSGWVAP